MGIKVVQKTFVVPALTATGNFDFTTEELDGLTPKGVIVRYARVLETDNTLFFGYSTNFGVYDGTNQGCCFCDGSGALSPGSQTHSSTSSSLVVQAGQPTPGSAGSFMTASGSAMLVDGVRLNLSVVGGSNDHFFDIIFFAGTDMSFIAGTGKFDGTTGFTTGFQAEAALFASVGIPANSHYNPTNNPTDQRWMPSQGFACQTPTGLVQSGLMGSVDEGDPTPAKTPRVLVDAIAGFLNPVTQIVDAEVSVSSFDATSINIPGSILGPEAGDEAITWCAISTGGTKLWDLQTLALDQTVSTTVEATGVGFKPDGVFFLPSSHTAAVDTVETVDTGWALSFSDGGNEGGLAFGAASESAGNSDISGLNRMFTRAITAYTWSGGSQTLTSQAFVSVIGTDGFTLEIEANSGVAESYSVPFMTFGEVDGTAEVTTDGQIAFATGAARTTTGNQNFTAPLDGVTPKAAWLVWTRATADAQPLEAAMGHGFVGSDGTQHSVAIRTQDNTSASVAGRSAQQSDRCIDMIKPDSAASEGVASFVSFITNGITVNWTTAPPSGWNVDVVLFAGVDVQASARVLEFRDDKDISALNCGFSPDFVIMASDYGVVGTPTDSENVAQAMSYITNEATPDTLFSGFKTDDSAGNTRLFYQVQDTDPWELITDFGTNAGTWTEQFKAEGLRFSHDTTALDQDITVFCVRIPGASFDARLVAMTAGTGSQSVTGLGFQPTHMISLLGASNTNGGVISTGPGNESVGWGFFNGVARQMSMGMRSDHGVATTDTGSFASSDKWVEMYQGDGTLGNDIEVTSVDADGFTVNKIDMTTGAILVPTLSIGAPVEGFVSRVWGNWL